MEFYVFFTPEAKQTYCCINNQSSGEYLIDIGLKPGEGSSEGHSYYGCIFLVNLILQRLSVTKSNFQPHFSL